MRALDQTGRDRGQPQALYRPLRPGPHGRERDHEQVLADQRKRLCGAMVEAAAQRGYGAVTVTLLVRLAAVSKRSFYEHFSGKEECFLATFDAVLADAAASVGAADDSRLGAQQEPLRSLFMSGAAYLEGHSKDMRLCIAEAPVAGPRARARVESMRRRFHVALARAVDYAFGVEAPPLLVIAGVAHGIWHLVRSRLLCHDLERPAGIAGELHGWLVSYCCPAGYALGPAPEILSARAVVAPCEPMAGDARRRMHRAALELVGRRGLGELSERSLLELARVSEGELHALYENAHACFLDALGLLAAEALAAVLAGARAAAGLWPAVVRASMVALLEWLAREPALARAAFVEALAGGADVQARTDYLLAGFASLLCRSAPQSLRPSQTLAEGIVAAVCGVLHDYTAGGALECIPELADHLSFIVLAPTMGAANAIETLVAPGVHGEAAMAEPVALVGAGA